jgi:hypothetical protein
LKAKCEKRSRWGPATDQIYEEGAMSGEQTSSVTYHVPDFIDSDGIEYTDIEVVVQMESDIRSTANLAKTLDRPLATVCK